MCIYCNIIFNYSHYLYVASFLYLFIFFSCASTALCIASMEFGGGRVDEEQKQKNVLAGIAGKNCRNDRRAVCNSTNVFHISRAFFFFIFPPYFNSTIHCLQWNTIALCWTGILLVHNYRDLCSCQFIAYWLTLRPPPSPFTTLFLSIPTPPHVYVAPHKKKRIVTDETEKCTTHAVAIINWLACLIRAHRQRPNR